MTSTVRAQVLSVSGQHAEIAIEGCPDTHLVYVADIVASTRVPALMLPGRTLHATLACGDESPQLWGWRHLH